MTQKQSLSAAPVPPVALTALLEEMRALMCILPARSMGGVTPGRAEDLACDLDVAMEAGFDDLPI
ncbi:hypothetical protein GCM10011452_00700 [Gemmobacter lanyuensis]|uniref:Uncharacterized protein n=1 Tax=Gemmobacter lanyuensis TaxID=1054497 RepID=A0A918IKL7_9RHOB|nr:hypothetical protein [Gemmobacter lanyuensis]GGW21218.1 hypothetical protein GCM10011452_00700 [Gemmobacter lanyuensis]